VKEYHVLNLGAGVQSTTLYLMSIQGTPRFDVAIFADTGEEPAAVYRHLEWLQTLAGTPILIRRVDSRRSSGRLGDDLLAGQNSTGQRFASIPAFTGTLSERGQVRRQCTNEYKTVVIERAIRREVLGLKPGARIPSDVKVHQYFGISLDEKSRATRIWERFHITGESKFEPHFPLIDRMMTRANCLDWLSNRVPHQVPRSACVFCPFHDDAAWQAMKSAGGADWERAVEVDHGLRKPGAIVNRNLNSQLYLHASRKPIDEVDFHPHVNPKELQLSFGVECEGMCGV
jgi:hypothetical protein